MAEDRDANVADGPAAVRSDADLDTLATVTPDDVEAVADYWQEHAPAEFRDLTEADVLPDEGGDDA